MPLIENTDRKQRMIDVPADVPFPSVDAAAPIALLARCPAHVKTPLTPLHDLALEAGIARAYAKDETGRMGLGSFKALGAAYVIAHEAAKAGGEDLSKALAGKTYVTASAGNHGMSVAAGAKVFGANSVIFLAKTVPSAFAARLRDKGAEVRVEGDDYEASMKAALEFAQSHGFVLLSDSSWKGYYDLPHRLMEGYLASAKEIIEEMPEVPTHVFLQAGVGGLAGAMAALFREAWGDAPNIIVVEPDAAPALQAGIKAGKPVFADGPVSNMGRLDCKEPSLIALKGLARDADFFLTVSDELASETVERLERHGISSTPSGVGGLTGLFAGQGGPLGLSSDSVALVIISEGSDA
ncbi:MAG: pyridoxal-phosphate dependent enzyme [Pseudomonadota bacterium]